MKRIMILMALLTCFIAPGAIAQSSVHFPIIVGDTVVNTGTVSKVFTATGAYTGAVVHVNLTRVAGTAGGTVQMYGSLDGVKYKSIGSAYTIDTNAAQTAMFYVTNPLPQYLKVLCTGSGSETLGVQVYYKLPNNY